MRVRILTDWSLMPVWVDRRTRMVSVDWYGEEIMVGKAVFSKEQDTWMFSVADGLENHYEPESRYTLSDEMDEKLEERIDVAINENQGDWFALNPTVLFFGAEPAPDYQTYECPHCGTELKEVKTVSGHTHQCPKCESLHAPYGRDE